MARCHRTNKKMLYTLVRQDGVTFSRRSHAHQLFTFIYDAPPCLHVRGTPNLFIFVLFADAATVTSIHHIALQYCYKMNNTISSTDVVFRYIATRPVACVEYLNIFHTLLQNSGVYLQCGMYSLVRDVRFSRWKP